MPATDCAISDGTGGLWVKVVFVCLLVLGAGSGAIYWVDQAEVEAHKREAMEAAALHGHLLQQQMVRSLSATYALAAVLRQGRGVLADFEALAEEMLPMYGGLSSLQLAPNGVIRRVVPLRGNEAAIGHNLLDDPARTKEAYLALESRKLTLAGPFELKQGGQAVVGRLPVFLDVGGSGERFWGFATAVIRIQDLLRASALTEAQFQGHDFSLTRIHPDSGEVQTIWASGNIGLDDPVSFRVTVPNGEWLLNVKRSGGWHAPTLSLFGLLLALLLVSLLSALLAYHLLRQPIRLSEEIRLRTAALNEANESLQTEIFQHWQTELALRESERCLERRVEERTLALADANTALQAEREAQKRLIDKLADARSQLLQSRMMAAVGQLAAGVAHEINNPIAFALSNVGTMERYVTALLDGVERQRHLLSSFAAADPELGERLQRFNRETDIEFIREDMPQLLHDTQSGLKRISRIVQDLRDFSFVDQSARQAVDIDRCLESVVGVMGSDFGARITVERQSAVLPLVECNAPQIAQVVRSLLLNAVQAISGAGVITISTRQVAEGMIEISIADTGHGIAPGHLDRIFEPFFTTRTVGGGTGMGLAVAYHVIKRHGGEILVESEAGRGATFTIHLPVRQSPLS